MPRLHARVRCRARRGVRGFTIIEMLVVIAVIGLLFAMLLPALSVARQAAWSAASLSNLRQLGTGMVNYATDHNGVLPVHSSDPDDPGPRTRWPDHIFPYVESTDVFRSPLLNENYFNKAFAHTNASDVETIYYGGYGYNYQYLGNSRTRSGDVPPFYARLPNIPQPAATVALGDTAGAGVQDPASELSEDGDYVIDPPLGSVDLGSQGSRRGSNEDYYGGDGEANRAMPAPRNRGKVNVVFLDGSGQAMEPEELDGITDDSPSPDNRYFNGHNNENRR